MSLRFVLRPVLPGFLLLCISVIAQTPLALPGIEANSNQTAAGALNHGILTISLEAKSGTWFPESDTGQSVQVFAFGEKGKPLQVPGPLIRVREGTTIRAMVQNQLSSALVLHGLHSHPGKADDVLQLGPGESREVTFLAGAPGTYAYWASAGGELWAGRPFKDDSTLNGAFIVDPASGAAPDRVFVIGMWRDRALPYKSLDIPTINGKSWPYTERFTYTAGSEVRWRWINPSSQVHPMHMHGSYYRVDSLGDGESDTPLADDQRKTVVTETLPVGGTMTTNWIPQRAGRWVFHCHILAHISAETALLHQGHDDHDHMQQMTGLIIGITVKPNSSAVVAKDDRPPRRLDLVVSDMPVGGPSSRGFEIAGNDGMSHPSSPGPALVLTRGDPVAIRVLNKLTEPTAIHWHGIELESYFDGVPGWGGDERQTTPMIMPGESFEARFTPPRAGTFIYHTHMKDLAQLSSGLYGPIIVLPPGENFNSETDKIFIASRNGIRDDGQLLLNGISQPPPVEWKAGTEYRLRIINIGTNNTMKITVTRDGKPVEWQHLAKDGADLPAAQAITTPATLTSFPGETYDFRLRPDAGSDLQLSVEVALFKEKVTQTIRVR